MRVSLDSGLNRSSVDRSIKRIQNHSMLFTLEIRKGTDPTFAQRESGTATVRATDERHCADAPGGALLLRRVEMHHRAP